jgi:predicted metal-dependent enzyme (double-stranded beta helix superfamily)
MPARIHTADRADPSGLPAPSIVSQPHARNSPLDDLCAAIAEAATRLGGQKDRDVAAALAPFLGIPNLLGDASCRCSADSYVRHLLSAGKDYTVLALVWRPGQMSPVHGHRTWCAFGVHRGWMTETFFSPGPQGCPMPRTCVERRVGDVTHAAADPSAIHRLANLGTENAISIHVYGAPFDRLGDEVNQIWAD